jgi:hypothetical protein
MRVHAQEKKLKETSNVRKLAQKKRDYTFILTQFLYNIRIILIKLSRNGLVCMISIKK